MADTQTAPREWFVAGGLIESEDGLLLVQNRRKNGSHDWTPPGGVVEIADGEQTLVGLTREVREETGLIVDSWSPLLYEVEAHAPDLGWIMRVQVHQALSYSGEITLGDDPDGIVVAAEYVSIERCSELVASGHQWVREPLLEWLALRWETPRHYRYRLEGAHSGRGTIQRV